MNNPPLMNKPPLFVSRNLGRRPKIFVALICSETSKNEVFRCFLDPPEGNILGIWGIMNTPLVSQHSTTRGGIHRNRTDSISSSLNRNKRPPKQCFEMRFYRMGARTNGVAWLVLWVGANLDASAPWHQCFLYHFFDKKIHFFWWKIHFFSRKHWSVRSDQISRSVDQIRSVRSDQFWALIWQISAS